MANPIITGLVKAAIGAFAEAFREELPAMGLTLTKPRRGRKSHDEEEAVTKRGRKAAAKPTRKSKSKTKPHPLAVQDDDGSWNVPEGCGSDRKDLSGFHLTWFIRGKDVLGRLAFSENPKGGAVGLILNEEKARKYVAQQKRIIAQVEAMYDL